MVSEDTAVKTPFVSTRACRLDFRRSLVSGLPSPRSAGSFPEQRLVIEPSLHVTFKWIRHDILPRYFDHRQNYLEIEVNLKKILYKDRRTPKR